MCGRFCNAKALAAFIGVSPRLRLSGSSVKGRSMLSRTGHAELRRALYMPGPVALRHNAAIRPFGQRLRAAGLAPKAVVGAAMRKLVHLIFGVIVPVDLSILRSRCPDLTLKTVSDAQRMTVTPITDHSQIAGYAP